MRFRDILALIMVILVGYVLLQVFNLPQSEDELTLNKFGNARLQERTAWHYLKKDVNGQKESVIYGETSNAETGSANIVTSVIVNYRSFDTLGEITVLFLAATALGAVLFGKKKGKKPIFANDGSIILTTGVRILFPLLILLGSYIFIHGHLTPGGGFQGGAIIATAFLLFFLSRKDYQLTNFKFTFVETMAGVLIVGLGIYGLSVEGSFLANFLQTGIVGELFSAGIIPIIYIAIGFKVGAELTSIISNLVEA